MEFKEYINKNKPVFIYIHGECLPTSSFKQEIKELKKDFTLVLPVLDGHSQQSNKPFTSIEDCANAIIKHIDTHYDGHVNVLSGFSLGGQVCSMILSKRPDFCDYAMIESALMKPLKLKSWSDLAAIYCTPLAKNKFFNSFMYYTKFNDDFAKNEYYENYKIMSKESIKSVLEATYSFNIPNNLDKVTGQVAIMVGQRESKIYKASADLLHKAIPNSQIFMLMNFTHGDFSLGYPVEFLRFVKSWVQKKDLQQRRKVQKLKEEQEGEYMPNYKHLINKIKEHRANKNTSRD